MRSVERSVRRDNTRGGRHETRGLSRRTKSTRLTQSSPRRSAACRRLTWESLNRGLTQWQADSDLWDAAAARRARIGRTIGTAATLLGFVTTAVGAWLSGHRNAGRSSWWA
jgi:hypothetical protein